MSFISAIDYSLSSPSICKYDTSTPFCFENCNFFLYTSAKVIPFKNIHIKPQQTWNTYNERYDLISFWVMTHVFDCSLVGLEGYSFGSKGRVFNIAENTGVLKHKLYKEDIPIQIIEPTTIKKFATNKGNASKTLMMEAFKEETNIDLPEILQCKKENPASDIVDSYYLCKYIYTNQ